MEEQNPGYMLVGKIANQKVTKTFDDEDKINTAEWLSGITGNDFGIPNMLYSPENIFANNIAALDVNFLNPNTYDSVKGGEKANEKAVSAASKLRETIASWYKSFRNIAIVGLLSVLIYLGIRILLSSTAADKAKYKENIKDWLVALCLVFVINIIMSGILMLTQKCNELFSTNVNEIVVQVEHDPQVAFKTNIMGLIRFQAQSDELTKAATYTVMYIVLVIYTIVFTVLYYKRFLYMAFFTMIAPLVALTYPIDKAGDGQAQAFNIWFKEYTMNAIIQPVHLILYSVFVGSAIDLAVDNPIYALVAIGFLIPAEKFIKKMFKLDKAETTGGFGSFAGGALTMSAMNKLASGGSSGNKKSGNGKSEKDNNAENGNHIFQRTNKGKLGLFQDGSDESTDGSDSNGQQQLDSGSNRNSNNDEENNPEYPDGFQPVDDNHRRLLEERQIWDDVANEEGSTDSNTNDAIAERDEIDRQLEERRI